ncbi:hypothetical protein PIB30_044968 [Stylosanthes scabra]|uniref:Uncharacterized protein n=1 Tax=Stylosanthes scabra TaxID=79078 RepID=A0ABU6TFQ5_9FABA|nr:hypothetical protein [Stylosanthes scabra]
MSFDIGSAAASTSSGPMYSGTVGGSVNFDKEEPLLEELGIHPEQIWSRINLFDMNHMVHKDSDLSGPILLYMSFCLFHTHQENPIRRYSWMDHGLLDLLEGIVAVTAASIFILWATKASTGLVILLVAVREKGLAPIGSVLKGSLCFLYWFLITLVV